LETETKRGKPKCGHKGTMGRLEHERFIQNQKKEKESKSGGKRSHRKLHLTDGPLLARLPTQRKGVPEPGEPTGGSQVGAHHTRIHDIPNRGVSGHELFLPTLHTGEKRNPRIRKESEVGSTTFTSPKVSAGGEVTNKSTETEKKCLGTVAASKGTLSRKGKRAVQ